MHLLLLVAVAQEGHVITLRLHLLYVLLKHTEGVLIKLPFFHFDESCLEQIHIRVDLFLLPLIEALALLWGLVGNLLIEIAEELRHLYEISTWLPVFPADFASGEEGSEIEGEQKETLAMFLEEAALGVELSFLSVLFDLQGLLVVRLDDWLFLLL